MYGKGEKLQKKRLTTACFKNALSIGEWTLRGQSPHTCGYGGTAEAVSSKTYFETRSSNAESK
jgi:hypothetical protein